MNFWYIEHHAACFGDDFDAKMYKFNLKWFSWTFGILNTTVQGLEMILLPKITNLKYQMVIQWIWLLIEELMHSHIKLL